MANTLKFGNGEWYGKKDTILAYNDENSNYKPLPFDFSRASKATRVNKDGLIEEVGSGQPRIDYKDDSEGALLLEPSRTNFLTYSEDFSNNSYTKTNVTVTSGFLAPNGSTNATKLVSSAVNGQLLFGGGSGNTNTKSVSVFAKANTSTSKFKIIEQYYSGHQTLFDLNLGVVEFNNSVGSKIEDYGNGWYKCTHIQSYTSGQTNATFAFRTNTPESLFIWGAQLEVGSYATSYIPTQGSTVTRSRDLSDTQNLSHVIGQTEGVIFYDAILVHKSTGTSEDLFELSIDDGSANNAFFINNYNNTLTVLLKSGGSTSFANSSFNPTEGARYKLGFAYKQNDFALYINGTLIADDSSGTVPTMNQITFGNYYDNRVGFQDSVKVNDFKLYNTRLSNSELAALTQV